MNISIRSAELSDIPAITEIYNDAVISTTATFDTEPKSEDERAAWFNEHGENYPVIVAETDGRVIGYASLSRYSSKKAYAATAELSVYVHKEFQGKGAGKKLMKDVLAAGKKAGLRAVLSRIAGDNEVSIQLHHNVDFFLVGTLREVGHKFGNMLDVHIFQILL